jgi:hypothetical protein
LEENNRQARQTPLPMENAQKENARAQAQSKKAKRKVKT